jgi:hypothetical protein
MPKQSITLSPPKSRSDWSVVAGFDDKNRLVINEGNLDDDVYITVTAGELAALTRVLNRMSKPRANSGDAQSDILAMLDTVFGGQADAFSKIETCFDEMGIRFSKSHWIGT